MKDDSIYIRAFDRERDYETVSHWWKQRGFDNPVLLEQLPKLGIMAHQGGKDLCAIWLYMDNSCGVCFAEHAISRPGLGLKIARAAFLQCIGFLKFTASEMDYGVMEVRTYPAIARVLEKAGFVSNKREIVSLSGWTR